jgi:alkanesulfonate monooxygenase SsuD/methylene tetrahydromethanopterin reductase-like flavin-dependent oxidoreductase (luciferase family)
MNTIQWVVDSGAHLMAATTFSSIFDLRRMRENLDQALSLSKRPEESLEFYVHVPIHVANRSFVELESDLAETFQRFATAAGMGGTIYQQTAGAPQGPFAGSGFNFANYYNNHAVMGSAEECVAKLASWRRELRFTHLTCMFNFGLPHELVMETMERFATQVMPAVREMAPCGTSVHPVG